MVFDNLTETRHAWRNIIPNIQTKIDCSHCGQEWEYALRAYERQDLRSLKKTNLPLAKHQQHCSPQQSIFDNPTGARNALYSIANIHTTTKIVTA